MMQNDEARYLLSFLFWIATLAVMVWFGVDANWGPATFSGIWFLYMDRVVESNYQILKAKGKV